MSVLAVLALVGCQSVSGRRAGGTLVALGDSYVANMNDSPAETWQARYAAARGLDYRQYGINGNALAIAWKKDVP